LKLVGVINAARLDFADSFSKPSRSDWQLVNLKGFAVFKHRAAGGRGVGRVAQKIVVTTKIAASAS